MAVDLIIKNGTIVNHDGETRCSLAVDGGKIVAISREKYFPEGREVIDASGLHVLPGLIDTHVHLGAFGKKHSMPTFREEVDGFKCAVIGGVTTLGNHLGMGDTAWTGSLKPKLREWVDYYNKLAIPNAFFYGGITSRIQLEEIPDYVREFGVTGFKWYAYSHGEQETWGMQPINDGDKYLGFKKIAKLGNRVLAMAHCENMDIIDALKRIYKDELKRNDLRAWYETRKGFVEALDIRKMAYIAKITGAHFYVVHVSSKEGVEAVIRAKEDGVNITAETCLHYLTHNYENAAHFGSLGVESPALKDKESNSVLWKALKNGIIECLGTDSGTMTKAHKSDTVWDALAGFSEDTPLIGPVMLSEGVNKGRISLQKMVEICCYNNARIHGLFPGKGIIKVGSDADLTIVDLEKVQKVTLDKLHYMMSDFSLFEDWELTGWPVMTIIGGEIVMKDGKITGKPGIGKYIPRHINE